MKKMRLQLDDIRVDTFEVTRTPAERGTVKGNMCCCCCCPCCCTGADTCGDTCQTCATNCGSCGTCGEPTCASCAGWTCDFSCDASCGGTCDYTCDVNCNSGYRVVCYEYPIY